jgi:hypothetical protein
MDAAGARATLEYYWEHSGQDEDLAHTIYHDDAVLEFPQSGEQFVGVANFREWRGRYPAAVDFRIGEVRGGGDVWVVECSISYEGGPWQPAVDILEFRGDKVARESIYVTEAWDAPDWRAPWRASP